MYYLKGFTKHSLILEGPDGKGIHIYVGPNKDWLDVEKLGTQVQVSLALDHCGYYVLGGIFKQGALLKQKTFYEYTLKVALEQTPPAEWLDCRVAIKIEKSL